MKEIILASNNLNKAREFQQIFGEYVKIKTLKDIDFNDKIIEDGKNFIENSLIKCRKVYEKIAIPVIADDSGLCVDSLNGAPGIFSARYGGENLTDAQRYTRLLGQIKKSGPLNASFVCALVLYSSPNNIYIVQEDVKGLITFEPKGTNGFGYDPIFLVPEFGRTMAELTESEKNSISHRGKAASLMKLIIEKIYG